MSSQPSWGFGGLGIIEIAVLATLVVGAVVVAVVVASKRSDD